MRTILTYSVLLFSLSFPVLLLAGEPEAPNAGGRGKYFNWKPYEVKLSKTQKIRSVHKITDGSALYVNELDRVHPLDFSGDGLYDIIFESDPYADDPGSILSFFLYERDSFRLVSKTFGEFSRIYSYGKYQQFKFQVRKMPCCDYHVYHVYDCELSSDTTGCIDAKMFIRDAISFRYCVNDIKSCAYRLEYTAQFPQGVVVFTGGDSSLVSGFFPGLPVKYDTFGEKEETKQEIGSDSSAKAGVVRSRRPDPYNFFFWPVIAGIVFVVAAGFIIFWKRKLK